MVGAGCRGVQGFQVLGWCFLKASNEVGTVVGRTLNDYLLLKHGLVEAAVHVPAEPRAVRKLGAACVTEEGKQVGAVGWWRCPRVASAWGHTDTSHRRSSGGRYE